jgi:hypothetical protein
LATVIARLGRGGIADLLLIRNRGAFTVASL